MSEAKALSPATIVTSRRANGPLGKDNLLSVIEAILDPVIVAISLWVIAISQEGELLPFYLILSVIVFSLTFPGTSRLQTSVGRMCIDIVLSWFWIAGLLAFLAFAARYSQAFSNPVLLTWLWAAPLSQIGVPCVSRARAFPACLAGSAPTRHRRRHE